MSNSSTFSFASSLDRAKKLISTFQNIPLIIDNTDDNIYIDVAKLFLTDARFNHSLSVAKLAYDVSCINNDLNKNDAYIAGILHDIAKDLCKDEQFELALNNKYFQNDFPKYSYHAFASAVIAYYIFNVNDIIFNAISFHCCGKDNLTKFEKLIYTADKCEPTRDFETSDVRNLLYEDIDMAFVEEIKQQDDYLKTKGIDCRNNIYTTSMYNYYVKN